jgi:hypothetical protein
MTVERSRDPALSERVHARFERERGRERLEADMRRVARDVVGNCEHDELDSGSKLLLRRITDAAVEAASDAMVERFVAELGRGIAGLPEPLRAHLVRAVEHSEVGWD